MRILTANFIAPFADRIMNIHPSLLPKYRGLHTHQRVLQAGDDAHGVSVHFVTEELDGGPGIIQACVEVRRDDSEASLSARVQRQPIETGSESRIGEADRAAAERSDVLDAETRSATRAGTTDHPRTG
jgi:folate-dependent phosphoribosylglycinamide formyltransferase PurN